MPVAGDDPAENVTLHEHPDDAVGDGDTDAIAAWLGDSLGQQLGDGTVSVSEGQYNAAREIFGDEYDDQLSAYAELAEETDREQDQESADRMADARDELDAFINNSEEFDSTYEQYEAARNAGDDAEARAYARELIDLHDELLEQYTSLRAIFEDLEEIAELDFIDAIDGLEAFMTERETTRTSVETAEFDETAIEIDDIDERGSPSDPISVAGTIVDADGEPLSNGTAKLTVGPESSNASVEANGSFTVSHAPVTAPVNLSEATLQYVPPPDSIYLGSTENVTVDLSAEEPTIEITESTERAQYYDTVGVTGRIGIGDEPVEHGYVETALGSASVQTTMSDADGQFATEHILSSTPAAGEHSITVTVGEAGTVLSPVSYEVPLTIEERETALDFDVSEEADGFNVSGTFTTANPTPVAEEEVQILVDDRVVETVTTDADGAFSTGIPASDLPAGESVTIGVRYDGTGTNLGESEATTTVEQASPTSMWGVVGGAAVAGIVLMGLLGLAIRYRRRVGDVLPERIGTPLLGVLDVIALWWARRFGRDEPASVVEGAPTSTQEMDTRQEVRSRQALDIATDRLEAGDAAQAVDVAYLGTRAALARQLADDHRASPRAFYRAWRSAGNDSSELQKLTEIFEVTRFGPEQPTLEQANAAITAARQLLEHERGSSVTG